MVKVPTTQVKENYRIDRPVVKPTIDANISSV